MINDSAGVPSDEVPEADWAEQQIAGGPDPDGTAIVRRSQTDTTEADAADVAEQEVEVVLDEED